MYYYCTDLVRILKRTNLASIRKVGFLMNVEPMQTGGEALHAVAHSGGRGRVRLREGHQTGNS